MTTGTILDKAMTEDELLQAITEAATLYGWQWHHVRRSDKALQMGDPGFPDLVLARKGHVLFLELKSQRGIVDDPQWAWYLAINGGEGVVGDAHIVRPADLNACLEALR